MGTFHDDKGELHGYTVVVDTAGPELYIGRCDSDAGTHIVLVDVDVHREGENGHSKAEYLERAARFGHWKKHEHLAIPKDRVTSVRKLGEWTL